jgi:hypothetical protein
VIQSWAQWEKAFRTFSAIYLAKKPERYVEIMEYQNVIQTAAGQYLWEAVYRYDKLFRHQMARDPHRSWAEINTRLYVQELNATVTLPKQSLPGGSPSERPKIDKPCHSYNKTGKCSWKKCRFVNKCSNCGKMGHPALTCYSKSKTEMAPNKSA